MTDRIELRGLRVRGHHGVYDDERRTGQDFVIDAVLELDLSAAAASDDVADTVHYGDLAQRLADIVAGEPVNLLEALAQRLAEVCLADERVAAVEVRVHKPQAPIPLEFADIAVTLSRRGRNRVGDLDSGAEGYDGGQQPPPWEGTRTVLSIGSNVGDRAGHLRSAVAAFGDALVAVSPVYETRPWGGVEQDPYLNAVLLVDGPAVPAYWLGRAHAAEQAAGREREVRWGPRTLDVDVVAVDGVTSDDPALTVPHPYAHERAFVLRPWLDLDPDAVLTGRRVAGLLAQIGDEGLVRRDDVGLG